MYETFAVRGPLATVAPFQRADRIDAEPDPDHGGEPDLGVGDDSLDNDAPLESEDDDPAAREARGAADDDAGDDDEDDDEDYSRYDGMPAEEQLKKLRAALKVRNRKLRARTPVYEQVSALTRQGLTLDDLVHSHRSYQTLAAAIRKNPRLAAILEGGGDDDDRRDTSRGRDRRQDDDEFRFDDSPQALGFDPNDASQPANKVIAKFMRDAAYANWRYERLEARLNKLGVDKLPTRVEQIDRNLQTSHQRAIAREWDSATQAALKHITNKGHQALFKDAINGYRREYAGKEPAAKIVAHCLKNLGINPATAAKATAAARSTSQAAARVAQLPRHPSQHGTSAPAGKRKENLRDVTRRIMGQVGRG